MFIKNAVLIQGLRAWSSAILYDGRQASAATDPPTAVAERQEQN